MADSPQSYENHTRWHAPFHFFLAPVLLTNVIVAVIQLVRDPGLDRGWWLVVSIALVVLAALVRINPLRVQDRVIRLEESLRYYQVLPEELAARAASLNIGQTIALRFAPDRSWKGSSAKWSRAG